MTLREQVEEVAVRRVNAAWFKAAGICRAVDDLLGKAFRENWPRDSWDARVILEFDRLLSTYGCVDYGRPGIK